MEALKGQKKSDHEGAPLAPPPCRIAQVNSLVDDEREKTLDPKSSDSKTTTTGGMKRKRCETVCTRYSDLEEVRDVETSSKRVHCGFEHGSLQERIGLRTPSWVSVSNAVSSSLLRFQLRSSR